jgi:hypothetical protein
MSRAGGRSASPVEAAAGRVRARANGRAPPAPRRRARTVRRRCTRTRATEASHRARGSRCSLAQISIDSEVGADCADILARMRETELASVVSISPAAGYLRVRVPVACVGCLLPLGAPAAHVDPCAARSPPRPLRAATARARGLDLRGRRGVQAEQLDHARGGKCGAQAGATAATHSNAPARARRPRARTGRLHGPRALRRGHVGRPPALGGGGVSVGGGQVRGDGGARAVARAPRQPHARALAARGSAPHGGARPQPVRRRRAPRSRPSISRSSPPSPSPPSPVTSLPSSLARPPAGSGGA